MTGDFLHSLPSFRRVRDFHEAEEWSGDDRVAGGLSDEVHVGVGSGARRGEGCAGGCIIRPSGPMGCRREAQERWEQVIGSRRGSRIATG